MCFFKKKKPAEIINSKYSIGEFVLFKNHKNEATNGNIYAIKKDENDKVLYDIQVGGECPSILIDIAEDKVIKKI